MTSWRRRAALVATVTCAAIAIWIRVGPLPADLLDRRQRDSTTLVDRHGEVLYEARASDGSRAEWIAADRLAPALVDATVAAEDRRFWRHPGIDPIAIARATFRNLRRHRVVEGGSTITQQVAKLLLAGDDGSARRRGWWAKLREAVVALRLEHQLTKREILALYLNLAPYGNEISGAGRASRAYFGHDAELLTPAQAAFLAALPQRPSWFNPYRDPARAKLRQERVIVQMGLAGSLTPDAVGEALRERLSLQREPAAFVAPHFVVRARAADGARTGGVVDTSLDAELQRTVEGIIRAERPALDRIGAHNVAVAVLDNRSGEWLAWEGSGAFDDRLHGGAIDGVTTPRQPGSALKPFTYAVAFEKGESPATVLPDVPSYFPTAEAGVLYSPRNYDNRFRGPLLARTALAGSENVPAVVLASRVGVPALLRFLRAAGFTTFDKTASFYGLGVTLGDAEVRLDQLVAAYAAFARGGLAVHPRFVRASGEGTSDPAAERLVTARTAFWITDILSDDRAREFAFGRGGSLEFPFPVAAKTGTSQGYHDNWTIGYTRNVTVGVWVGNFDRQPLVGSSGVSGAGPIFHAVMLAAEERAAGRLPLSSERATVAEPERTSKRRICALSGMTASPWCPAQADEWTPHDALQRQCTWHEATPRGVVVRWPAEYEAWARAERLLEAVAPLPPRMPAMATSSMRAQPDDRRAALKILSPPDGGVYLIDPTLRRQYQTLPFRAAASSLGALEWHVDGRSIGRHDAKATVDWSLVPGAHTITVRDDRGRSADVGIVVK